MAWRFWLDIAVFMDGYGRITICAEFTGGCKVGEYGYDGYLRCSQK